MAQTSGKVYLDFMRPFTLLPPALGMLSGSVVALGACGEAHRAIPLTIVVILKIVTGGLLAALLNAASNGINQIYDLEIDKINKPTRPLPAGTMSLPAAWWTTVACYLTALLLAGLISVHCAWLVGITALFTVAYSAPPLRTKRHWLLAAFTIAIPRGIFLKVAGWSVLRDMFTWEPWFLGGIFGLFLLGATTTKDYADILGDRRCGCSTLPIRFGIVRSILMITPFFVLPFLLFPLGVYWQILTGNRVILCGLGGSLCCWGGYVVYLLLRDPNSLAATENHPSWSQMYLMMMYAQIGLGVAYLV